MCYYKEEQKEKEGGMDVTPLRTPQQLRCLYRLCYGLGSLCTLATLALLGWIAYHIAIESAPLASLSFLPEMPVWCIFILIALVLVISIAAWQGGANFHQQYEEAVKNQPQQQ